MLLRDANTQDIPNLAKYGLQWLYALLHFDKGHAEGLTESSAGTIQVRIVCARCAVQSNFAFEQFGPVGEVSCPNCHSTFTSHLVQVRAKESRVDHKRGKRTYSIQACSCGRHEELIEFDNADPNDFELHPKDLAIFTYLNGELKVVQNISTDRYLKVSKPGCYVATYLYGPQSEEVSVLRAWRDDVLLNSTILTHAVRAYYYLSPLAIAWFGDHQSFKAVALFITKQVLKIAHHDH